MSELNEKESTESENSSTKPFKSLTSQTVWSNKLQIYKKSIFSAQHIATPLGNGKSSRYNNAMLWIQHVVLMMMMMRWPILRNFTKSMKRNALVIETFPSPIRPFAYRKFAYNLSWTAVICTKFRWEKAYHLIFV